MPRPRKDPIISWFEGAAGWVGWVTQSASPDIRSGQSLIWAGRGNSQAAQISDHSVEFGQKRIKLR
jgi:hypothetical protein